jgi:hypothetical protein
MGRTTSSQAGHRNEAVEGLTVSLSPLEARLAGKLKARRTKRGPARTPVLGIERKADRSGSKAEPGRRLRQCQSGHRQGAVRRVPSTDQSAASTPRVNSASAKAPPASFGFRFAPLLTPSAPAYNRRLRGDAAGEGRRAPTGTSAGTNGNQAHAIGHYPWWRDRP